MHRSYLFTFLALLFLAFVQAQPTKTEDGLLAKRQPSRRAQSSKTERELFIRGGSSARTPFKRSLCSTNAECLRRGLPLLKPAKRGTGTRALRPRQSDSPEVFSGGIEVFNSDRESLGYISKTLNDDGGYDITTDASEAVTLLFSQNGDDPFTFTISSDDRQGGYPYLGAVFNDQTSNLGSGASAFALLSGISREISGPAQADEEGLENTRGLYNGQETAIFLYNSETQEITGQWINTDGSKPITMLFLASSSNYGFGLISPADYSAFVDGFGVNPTPVSFKYVTIPPPP
ncbi:hypothetical protein I302_108790 [Kwoniella bestiolae CBS 10118]|uniref:Peptidase A1 domain-containing protein n=1 Tax=Kwoniella bestiolae CBS 10118 TaxID=1296100 RepID=A0A1B9FU47_9TREE|nr:hypothetical protein I302_07927 [Kwoniella bestiolae CBS 10118]OCF22282.1 hypothetical protein I302_07927 [Kwoniella bestiolae CBS 10118]